MKKKRAVKLKAMRPNHPTKPALDLLGIESAIEDLTEAISSQRKFFTTNLETIYGHLRMVTTEVKQILADAPATKRLNRRAQLETEIADLQDELDEL